MSNPLNGILGSSGGGSGGSGDVVGPASATDNAIARFEYVDYETLFAEGSGRRYEIGFLLPLWRRK